MWSSRKLRQGAAEGASEVGLGERRGGRARGEHGAIDDHNAVAKLGHRAEIVRRDEHDVPLVAQARGATR